jgi:anthranilate synthase component 2
VVRGELPVHGKVSEVHHSEANLFAGCPHPMRTARYHSLVVARDTLPDVLQIDAETDDGAIMAISHRERQVFGIQFHPESYGTAGGDRLIENFLAVCHPERSRGIPFDRVTTAPPAGDPSTSLGMTRGARP